MENVKMSRFETKYGGAVCVLGVMVEAGRLTYKNKLSTSLHSPGRVLTVAFEDLSQNHLLIYFSSLKIRPGTKLGFSKFIW